MEQQVLTEDGQQLGDFAPALFVQLILLLKQQAPPPARVGATETSRKREYILTFTLCTHAEPGPKPSIHPSQSNICHVFQTPPQRVEFSTWWRICFFPAFYFGGVSQLEGEVKKRPHQTKMQSRGFFLWFSSSVGAEKLSWTTKTISRKSIRNRTNKQKKRKRFFF